MRRTITIPLALAALPISTLAVSLVDFPPRLSNLPPSCSAAYTSQIAGCSSTDFTSGSCSTTCIAALVALEPFIQIGCASAGISGQNVIAAFLAGQGPSSLCPNAKSVLSSSSSSSAPSPSPTSNPLVGPPQQTSKAGNLWTTSSSTSTSSSSTSSSSSSSTTTTSSSTTTASSASSTTTPAAVQSTTSAEQTPSKTTSSQSSQNTSTDRSGGGSPFDTSDATPLMLSIPAALVVSGLTMFAAIW